MRFFPQASTLKTEVQVLLASWCHLVGYCRIAERIDDDRRLRLYAAMARMTFLQYP